MNKQLKIVLIVLAVAVVGYAAVKIGMGGIGTTETTGTNSTVSGWNHYSYQGNIKFSFDHPSSWSEPQKKSLKKRERLVFKDGLVVEAGDFYSKKQQKNLTAKEAAENDVKVNPGEPKKETVKVAGTEAQKVSFTIPSGFLGEQKGQSIPPEDQNVTDVLLQKSSSSPLVFMRYSKDNKKTFNKILDSFQFSK